MKKVLIFSLAYRPFVGGVEVALRELTDRIPAEEIEFHVLTLRVDSNLPKTERLGNTIIHRIGFSRPNASSTDITRFPLRLNIYWYQFTAAFYALALNRNCGFDAIWAMMAHTAGVPAAMYKIAKPRTPYLLTLQEGDPPDYIERLMRPVWPLFSRAFTSADRVQAISLFLMGWARRRGFHGKGVVIPNGVDLARFTYRHTLEQVAGAKEKLGKKDGDIFLVTTSRLVHKNAVDSVIEALPLLPANVSFLIYGIGPEEASLRTLALERGVGERVRFMGQISHEEMPLMLSACDLFIRPSRSEGMGNSFIEAMAAGLPVIATQEGGISDFLFDVNRSHGKEPTGWAVAVDSPTQIARAVEDILSNPGTAARVKEAARSLVIKKYDWDSLGKDMRALFGELLDSRGGFDRVLGEVQ
ncbi:MAG: 1,2-diacylglycerol 3-glucosyltransferase [Parcubacteria group bacterium]|nr:1,2-diacylglycerol 3-glucosyltransferase [Parcubacteria group bacterium]